MALDFFGGDTPSIASEAAALLKVAPSFYADDVLGSLVLQLDASSSQQHELGCEVTAHPVEEGVDVADHVRRLPRTLQISGVISTYPLGKDDQPGRLEDAWSLLEGMIGQVFEVVTTLRRYPKMVLRHATVTRSSPGSSDLEPQLELVEIQTVSLQVGVLPPEVPAARIKKVEQKANGPAEQNLGAQSTGTPTGAGTEKAQSLLRTLIGLGA